MKSEQEPPATPFHLLGGHPTFVAICGRFYDLMESKAEFADLRAMHAANLDPMRTALPLFLAGWAGGPRDWFEANPGRCMMSVHERFRMTPKVAKQWADAMSRAIADVAPQPAELAQAMSEALAKLALGMGRD